MREDVCWKVDEHDVTKVRENIPNKKRKTMKRQAACENSVKVPVYIYVTNTDLSRHKNIFNIIIRRFERQSTLPWNEDTDRAMIVCVCVLKTKQK